GFEVKEASENEIVLKNSNSITLTLDKDKKNYFTDSWYFQTSDEGKGSTSSEGYVIYPATDVTVEDKTVSGVNKSKNASNESISNESASSTSSAPLLENKADDPKDSNSSLPDEKAETASSAKTSGFELLAGVLGIILCQYFIKRRG
ncbi:MAG: hypothetical protein SA398_17890, partial [Methanosarcina sp.]|nr:hypothetical protein [Methanosarcina sp.]